MKLQPGARYFNEYMFQQMIEDMNQDLQKNNDKVITTSQARKFHGQFLEQIALSTDKNGVAKTLNNSGWSDFSRAATAVFGKSDSIISKSEYAKEVVDFGEIIGINPKKSTVDTGTKGKKSTRDVGVNDTILPLSPYDNRFADRSCFRRNGSRLLYSKGADINKLGENFDDKLMLHRMDARGNLKQVGKSMTNDDYSGMSLLMRYLSKSEYNAVVDHVNKVGEKDKSQYMTTEAVTRSCHILKALQDEGTLYTISCDKNVGQIKASLVGTKISIRLTDSRPNENFIGRVYDNGHTIRYITNARDKVTNKTMPYNNTTAEDCVRLLHFAQGKSVMRNDIDAPVGLVKTYRSGQNTVNNEVYHASKNYSAMVGPYPGDDRSKVFIYVDNERSGAIHFRNDIIAETYLRESIDSARKNFTDMVAVDSLIASVEDYQNDPEYLPEFSGDVTIAAIQQSYWEVLTCQRENILKPGVSNDAYDEQIASLSISDQNDTVLVESIADSLVYDKNLSPEEKVQMHAYDMLNYSIGTFDADMTVSPTGLRFDPVQVANRMTSAHGKYSNNDTIVAALRKTDIDSEQLRGNDFYNKTIKDRMLKFDTASATPMSLTTEPFLKFMFDAIKTTINETGAKVDDQAILIDKNGVVHYTAQRVIAAKIENGKTGYALVTGELGQLFVPDDMGLVETQFAGTDNHLFTPGYEAYVVPQVEGQNESLEERTRLRGLEQIMHDAIRYQIHSDLMAESSEIGSPTSVNSSYRRLYETRYPLDLVTQSRNNGMSDDLLNDIIKTNSLRVRYPNELREESTINADYQHSSMSDGADIANDNYQSYYDLTGRRNMSIMTEAGDGYFDPAATGNSTNQGITRYLVESASIGTDGRIARGHLDDMTPLMKNDVCSYMRYIPFDRRQMTFNNLLQASCVAKKVNTAQMTFGGWTFDDGYVVSKDFAENYPIRDSQGKLRPLLKGDKISDMNGNKGVLSLIIDPDMDLAEAEKQGILEPVKWFKANKGHLDIVGAPFPATSRFNGGSARELMENPHDLIAPDGTVHSGCVGKADYIITHMAVDEKTHIYGEDELAQGKGRKASASLAWAFASQGAVEVLKECYSTNNGAVSNLREMMITMGLDLDEVGNMRASYQPHADETRRVFTMPELVYKPSKNGQSLDTSTMKKHFGDVISQSGGVLEVPFSLTYPTKECISPLNVDKTDVIHTEDEWKQAGYNNRDGIHSKSAFADPTVTYGLPVMSAYLRSGQEFNDGTSSVHDYTNHYLRIYDASIRYIDARDRLAKGQTSKAINKAFNEGPATAQAEFDKITNDLKTRRFSGKHNVFRDGIMANKMPNSATAVWTADPRLDVDQVAMSPTMADGLGLKENDYVLVWRDPMLRDAGGRYLRTKIDATLIGVAINPTMDKSFDGDFDGDSVALVVLQGKAARAEAMAKLTVDANLLDYGIKDPETGKFEIMMQDSLDMKSAAYEWPQLADRRSQLTEEVNAFESNTALKPATLAHLRHKAVNNLSDYTKASFSNEFGHDLICFGSMEEHIKSVEHMVINGAKGSYPKLQDYAKYLGVEFEQVAKEIDPLEPIDMTTIKDLGEPVANRESDKAVEYATAVKAFGTGVAGMYSQRGILALRNTCAKAILELTYPVTQSILQSKHDPVEALHKYELMQSAARDLWRGNKLERCTDDEGATHWRVERGDDGNPVQATPEQFKSQFMDIYTSKEGLNVSINEDYVDLVKDGLTKTDENGQKVMMDIEKEGRDTLASPMDKLAYGGDFDTLLELSKAGENLFEGEYNQHFAPRTILKNKEALLSGEVAKAIVKTDTKASYQPKKEASMAVGKIVNMPTPSIAHVDHDTAEAMFNARHYSEKDIQDSVDALLALGGPFASVTKDATLPHGMVDVLSPEPASATDGDFGG